MLVSSKILQYSCQNEIEKKSNFENKNFKSHSYVTKKEFSNMLQQEVKPEKTTLSEKMDQ